MIQANKNGFLYVLDRTNCELIAAHPYVEINWATHIDLATGRPVLTEIYERFLAGEEVAIWPSRGSNAVPVAFNPNARLVYTSSWHIPRIQKLAPPQEQVLGRSSTGVVTRVPPVEQGDLLGHFVAIDPLTGEFIALDEATGETLWEFKTGSSINSTAITYTHEGVQHVTVASGLGGLLANRYAAGTVPTGGSVLTFALMSE